MSPEGFSYIAHGNEVLDRGSVTLGFFEIVISDVMSQRNVAKISGPVRRILYDSGTRTALLGSNDFTREFFCKSKIHLFGGENFHSQGAFVLDPEDVLSDVSFVAQAIHHEDFLKFVVIGHVGEKTAEQMDVDSGFVSLGLIDCGRNGITCSSRLDLDMFPRIIKNWKGFFVLAGFRKLIFIDVCKKNIKRVGNTVFNERNVLLFDLSEDIFYMYEDEGYVRIYQMRSFERGLICLEEDFSLRVLNFISCYGNHFLVCSDVLGSFLILSRTGSEESRFDEVRKYFISTLIMEGSYFIGDVITDVCNTSLSRNVRKERYDDMIYSTISGGMGVFKYLANPENIEFLQCLEMHMRQASSSLLGYDFCSFRSTVLPCKGVIDGELCLMFLNLDLQSQTIVCSGISSSKEEVGMLLEEVCSGIR
jgi:hypothetical protein